MWRERNGLLQSPSTNVHKQIDNYNQAKGCMLCMEKRLAEAGRSDKFNKHFQDNVDRGVFRKLTKE
jgi:hypothetical protein